MISECMEVFEALWTERQDKLILDDYVPADGSYIFVDDKGSMKVFDVKMDKKSREVNRDFSEFPLLCFYDYYSQLITMNKPQDPGKIVHSNNIYSFWIKKDSIVSGKLTDEVIDRYYEVLSNPRKKYEKSKEAMRIYASVEEKYGEVDLTKLEENKSWIKEHVFRLDEKVDLSKKDYLKIFFRTDVESLVREAERYFLPNIYNSNDYNVEIEGEVYGLPNNNLGMNAKKPFLAIKTRKCAAPYLLNVEDVMMQKRFFDYLYNLSSAGKNNLYVDIDRKKFIPCRNGEIPGGSFSGFFLRLQKGKTEVEIHNQDVIPFHKDILPKKFEFQNVIGIVHKTEDYNFQYHDRYKKYSELEELIDDIFFYKYLKNNYFTDIDKLNISDSTLKRNLLMSRGFLFDWLHKGIRNGTWEALDKLSMKVIMESIAEDKYSRMVRQSNMRYSLRDYLNEGGEKMGSIVSELRNSLEEKLASETTPDLENDREFFYAVGQMVNYLISLNKGARKTMSLVNPFLNAKTDQVIKEKIRQYVKKYDYAIGFNWHKVHRLLAMIVGYFPDGPVDQDMILLGYACNNLLRYNGDKKGDK